MGELVLSKVEGSIVFTRVFFVYCVYFLGENLSIMSIVSIPFEPKLHPKNK